MLRMIPSNHPIRVVMISQDYLPRLGGAEKQLSALAPLFRERNVEIHILTRRYPGLAAFESIGGVPVYRLPVFKTKTLTSLIFTLTAIPVIRRLQPDILHAHGLLSPTTTAVMAKRLLRIPVVSKSLRGGILGDLTRLIKKPFGRRRFQMLQKQVDAFVVISNEIKHELMQSGISPERCFFIPNGVNLDEFRPATQDVKHRLRKQLKLPDGPLVIFVGRLELEKRVDQLIQVWLEIQRAYSDSHLLILGTGSQEENLKRMAAGNVLFRGAVDNVAAYLQAADLFVLPSVAEGLSNALLEALASGVAVVATATGGTIDIVRHKISGWLIHDYTPRNLAEGIQAFLHDESLRKDCGLEGRRFVLENYSLPNTADKLFELYMSLVRSN